MAKLILAARRTYLAVIAVEVVEYLILPKESGDRRSPGEKSDMRPRQGKKGSAQSRALDTVAWGKARDGWLEMKAKKWRTTRISRGKRGKEDGLETEPACQAYCRRTWI